jgi:hypothetical protein
MWGTKAQRLCLDCYLKGAKVKILLVAWGYGIAMFVVSREVRWRILARCRWKSVLWIRIRKDPKLFAGSGSVTRGYGSGFGSETGLKSY